MYTLVESDFLGDSPGKLRQICFRLEFEQEDEQRDVTVSFELIAPSGTKLINLPEQHVQVAKKRRAVVVLSHLDLVMYEAGTHTLRVTDQFRNV